MSPQPGQAVRAVPGAGLDVPIWILGSSLFGAQLAAALGLPFAFASHFAPAMLFASDRHLSKRFRPSAQLDKPYVMLGRHRGRGRLGRRRALVVHVASTVVRQSASRAPDTSPAAVARIRAWLTPLDHAQLNSVLSHAIVGSPDTVRAGLDRFVAQTGADELIIASQLFDHATRLRSFEIVADMMTR